MSTYKLRGLDAIRIAEIDGVTLRCYASPVENGGIVTPDKAREIIREHAGLIYANVEWTGQWRNGVDLGFTVSSFFWRGEYHGPASDGAEPVWRDSALIRAMSYEAYQVTIKTDLCYWENHEDPDDGPDDMEHRLRERFPGIQIRTCRLIGHAPKDDTTGPDPSIVREIDEAYDWMRNTL